MEDISQSDSSHEHLIVYFVLPDSTIPGKRFLDGIPTKIAAKFGIILGAVAKAPPHRFSGGGYWEKMQAPLIDLYEVRIDDGFSKKHHRLFCTLDYAAMNSMSPYLVILDGRTKSYFSVLSRSEYSKIMELKNAYFEINPRSIV